MDVVALGSELVAEARSVNERRMLVLAGGREECYDEVRALLDRLDVPITRTTLVGERDVLQCERLSHRLSSALLGTTRDVIVLDAHDELDPNVLGRTVGVVDGGGLLVLLAPPLADWPERRDGFDEGMAVPPFSVSDVTARFRRRFVELLRVHPGIAVVDLSTETIERTGLTEPAPRYRTGSVEPPDGHAFTTAAYHACRTDDQVEALAALEALRPDDERKADTDPGGEGSKPRAVVVEANRGRGKSSAAGLAAGSLASDGEAVLVTAPRYENAREVFARAKELLASLGTLTDSERGVTEATGGGKVWYLGPSAAAAAVLEDPPDVLFVDEAAALPVRMLERFLVVPRIAFTTTVHGYEGTGRGFSVRFRDRLDAGDHSVETVRMNEPIRYAQGDPIETWSFRTLLLDARPAVDELVTDATVDDVEYARLAPERLLADEHLLRETFGLLVLAHYRTEPADLARLLDAPNLSVHALLAGGHVVSVALLASEGGLSEEVRRGMYEGVRVRGNMIPDVLTSQLRDENGGVARGLRVVRIATHHAVRSRGFGSLLLEEVRERHGDEVDWFGAGYGATPELLSFWARNGFSTVHISTRRNDTSGEYSAIMLSPSSEVGDALVDGHVDRFVRRIPSVLSDTLSDLDPDVVRAALKTARVKTELDLSSDEWRFVVDAAYGPGHVDVNPGPFREVTVAYLVEPTDLALLSARQERLLVMKALQARTWSETTEILGYVSTSACMRAFGEAFRPLVETYGDDETRTLRDRYR